MPVQLVIANRNDRRQKQVAPVDLRIRDRRGELVAAVEAGQPVPLIYGYAGVVGIPVYREVLPNTKITTGVTGNTAENRARFGNWFANTQGREANYLLLQQYVLGLSSIQQVYTVFLNDESLNYDGWLSVDVNDDKHKWAKCAHHLGAHAVTLATAYSSHRRPEDRFTDLFAVSGLYRQKSVFDGRLPTAFFLVLGNLGKYVTSGDANLVLSRVFGEAGEGYGTPCRALDCLLDYLLSADYGLGLTADEIELAGWRAAQSFASRWIIDDQPLTRRLRQDSYDVDDGNTYLNFGIPVVARYPIGGVLPSTLTVSQVLDKFTEVIPNMLLWERFDGKLAVSVWNIDADLTTVIPDVELTVDALITAPRISVNTQSIADQVTIKYVGYEHDYVNALSTAGVSIGSRLYAEPGTYEFIVPDDVTELSVHIRGGTGGHGGDGGAGSNSPAVAAPGSAGGVGGAGYTVGADGGAGGAGSRVAEGGGENGQRAIYPGSRGGVGGRTVARPFTFPGSTGSLGGGGGGGGSFRRVPPRVVGGGGGGGGGQGGSSAVSGVSATIEAAGGAGGGGGGGGCRYIGGGIYAPPQQGLLYHLADLMDTTLAVTPGEMITVVVGAGGGGGLKVDNQLARNSGPPGEVQLIWSSAVLSGRTEVRTVDLCFCEAQAKQLSREYAEDSSRPYYEFMLGRRGLLLEPGDVVRFADTDYLHNIALRVVDLDIDENLHVTVLAEHRGILPPPPHSVYAPQFDFVTLPALSDITVGTQVYIIANVRSGEYDNLTYAWDLVLGPGVFIAHADPAIIIYTPDAPGAVTIRCVVTTHGEGILGLNGSTAETLMELDIVVNA